MKKLVFILAAATLLMGAGQALSAQEYIPKNEFTINVFGGVNQGMALKPTGYYDLKTDFVPAFGAGLGYIAHFNEHWALQTGIDAALYTFKVQTENPDFVDIESGMAYTFSDPTGLEQKTMCIFWHSNLQETTKLGSLQIPLMLQFKAPLSERIHFYMAGGATLALNLYGKFEQTVDKVEMTDPLVENSYATTTLPSYDITNQIYTDNGALKGDVKNNLIDVKASLEMGLRWALSPSVGLYTGVFVDYGILNVFANEEHSIITDETDPSEWGTNATPGTMPSTPWTNKDNFKGHSIFNSCQEPKYETEFAATAAGVLIKSIDGNVGDPYFDKINAGMAGVKVRFSFGKARKAPKVEPVTPPEPQIVYVPVKADTVTVVKEVVKKDTVTLVKEVEKVVEKEVVKVVRDTVTVIKEVPVEIQKVMKDLSNTLFAFNKFDLNDTAKGYLNEVADWLKKNENLKIEIAGHTDSKGSDEYNQKLSESRAKEVYLYFVEHGVKPDNLSYKGYGESQPIATNETNEGRQQNRRVELKILD